MGILPVKIPKYKYPTQSPAEIDFVLQTPHEVIPIEVKYSSHPRPQDASAIEQFIGLYPQKARRGFVVCRVKQSEQLSVHVEAIPWQEM